jgi:hypothetical protein
MIPIEDILIGYKTGKFTLEKCVEWIERQIQLAVDRAEEAASEAESWAVKDALDRI